MTMTEREYRRKLKKIQNKNIQKEYRESLNREKNKYKKKLHIETHKVLAMYLFILINVIITYTLVAMWIFQDISLLDVLITSVVSQVIVYAVYCIKAYKGKKQEEQMRLEYTKLSRKDCLNVDTDYCEQPDPEDDFYDEESEL